MDEQTTYTRFLQDYPALAADERRIFGAMGYTADETTAHLRRMATFPPHVLDQMAAYVQAHPLSVVTGTDDG